MIEFKKSDFDFYEDYAYLDIHVVAYQNFDVNPTSLWIRINCVDAGGKVLYELINTKTIYIDYRKSDAIVKDLRYIIRVLKKIHKPNLGINIYVYDLLSYLFLTKQLPSSSISMKNWLGLFYKALTMPTIVYLGDKDDKLKYERFIQQETAQSKYLVPSLEMLGTNGLKFLIEQKQLRELLYGRD